MLTVWAKVFAKQGRNSYFGTMSIKLIASKQLSRFYFILTQLPHSLQLCFKQDRLFHIFQNIAIKQRLLSNTQRKKIALHSHEIVVTQDLNNYVWFYKGSFHIVQVQFESPCRNNVRRLFLGILLIINYHFVYFLFLCNRKHFITFLCQSLITYAPSANFESCIFWLITPLCTKFHQKCGTCMSQTF